MAEIDEVGLAGVDVEAEVAREEERNEDKGQQVVL